MLWISRSTKKDNGNKETTLSLHWVGREALTVHDTLAVVLVTEVTLATGLIDESKRNDGDRQFKKIGLVTKCNKKWLNKADGQVHAIATAVQQY